MSNERRYRSYGKHFFKIILQSTIERKKLGIPPMFVKTHGQELHDVATFNLPNGHVWKLGLTKNNGEIWFDRGWTEFAEHHSIGVGYLLLFKYEGNSCFDVLIFNHTACDLQYPLNKARDGDEDRNIPKKHGGDDVEDDSSSPQHRRDNVEDDSSLPRDRGNDVEDDGSVEILNSTCGPGRRESSHKQPSSSKGKPFVERSNSALRFQKRATKRKRALSEESEGEMLQFSLRKYRKRSRGEERALLRAKQFKSTDPYFILTMRSHSKFKRITTAYVPASFARKFLRGRVSDSIKIQDPNGREWPLRAIWRGKCDGLDLCSGWSNFARNNNIEEGDICVFELISLDDVVLKVSIFRASSVQPDPEINKHGEGTNPMEEDTHKSDNLSSSPRCSEEEMPDMIIISDDEIELETTQPRKNGKSAEDEDLGIFIHHRLNSVLAMASTATKEAYQAAIMFKSSNPLFLDILRPYHIKRSTMTVPCQFARNFLSGASDMVKVQAPDNREFSYPVCWRGSSLFLNVNWCDLDRENELAVGNVCIFELINKTDCVLKLHIFRAS